MNDRPMDLGMTLFLCVFLIPFVTVGIGMTVAAVVNLIGKVEVIIDEFDTYVATGIGFIRWKKRFDPRKSRRLSLVRHRSSPKGTNKNIEITANRIVKFGSMLQQDA